MKKLPNRIFKLTSVVLSFIVLFLFFSCVCKCLNVVIKSKFTIVLDAGHGGVDGGAVGANGTIEKVINLEYVKILKEKLNNRGFKVYLIRENDNGLYSIFDKNKKKSDMKKRITFIKNCNPNLVISIHMNSYRDENVNGVFTYFREGDEQGKMCANLIQKTIKKYCNVKQEFSRVGDYYILNESYYTSVLIECGFLSNPEEEKRLNSEQYKNKITDAICDGILLYSGVAQI